MHPVCSGQVGAVPISGYSGIGSALMVATGDNGDFARGLILAGA